jgi:hypothetical protein
MLLEGLKKSRVVRPRGLVRVREEVVTLSLSIVLESFILNRLHKIY